MNRVKLSLGLVLVASILFSGSIAQNQEQQQKGKSTASQKQHDKDKKSDQLQGKEKKAEHMPPGQAKKEQGEAQKKRPAGWDRGEKEGWETSFPPGWEKRDEASKKSWQKELDDAKEHVRAKGKSVKKGKAKVDSFCVSVEAAARKGVPVGQAQEIVEKGIDKGLDGRELEMTTRAMAYGVEKQVESAPLAEFVSQKLDEGVRGDELASQIHQEVDRRHEEIQKAKEALEQKKPVKAKRWWEFWK